MLKFPLGVLGQRRFLEYHRDSVFLEARVRRSWRSQFRRNAAVF
jgi:hypothetical protein